MDCKLLLIALIAIWFAPPSSGQDSKHAVEENPFDQSSAMPTKFRGQPISLVSRVNQLEAEFREKIAEINMKTSRKSEDQEENIAIIRARERNLAQLLNKTVEEMGMLKTQNKEQSKRIDQLEQKLSKLIQNTSPAQPGPLTPPSSCQELEKLKYNLDGLYLVKNKLTNKIQTVFCQFSAFKHVSQTLMGNVDIKTKSVHFYVQKNYSFSEKSVIPFELERLNEGGAMNLVSGVFTAPIPGIYHFQFSCLAEPGRGSLELDVHIQLNGKKIGTAFTSSERFFTTSLTASLRLKAKDQVTLYKAGGVLHDSIGHHTDFAGWLVEEDLI